MGIVILYMQRPEKVRNEKHVPSKLLVTLLINAKSDRPEITISILQNSPLIMCVCTYVYV